MKTLTIKDLAIGDVPTQNASARVLTRLEMSRVQGGRAVVVTVDGRSNGTVDDFSLTMEIFKGNIGGPMI